MNVSPPPRQDRPRIAYLVSAYPAVSHTFILREVRHLRSLGHDIVTASINAADRAPAQMDPEERREAGQTYVVKRHGVVGAVLALLQFLLLAPRQLLATLAFGWRMGAGHGRGLRGLAYAVEAAMVARWMRAQQAGRLHVHFGSAGASVGVLVKQLTGCHLSITIHGPDEFDDVTAQQLALKVRHADAVICISQFAKGQLMRLSDPSQWPKLRVCRLGVAPSEFAFSSRPAAPEAALLCVGRLTPAKGQVLLIQALARLRDAGLPCRLTLVGGGPDRARIEAAIAAHGLADRVTLTGALNPQAVRAELERADIFVLPSLAEGIPVVLMEAMSSGLPCVSTPVNGIPELIEHGRSGLLAVPGDVDSLTEQLRRLIEQPALRDPLALAARGTVEREFDLARNVAALGRIFDSFAPAAHVGIAAPACAPVNP